MTRRDGDSWDLLTGVGWTAAGIAAARALASNQPNPLIDDPFARPLVQELGEDYFIRMADGIPAGEDTGHGQDLTLLADGMGVRTESFDHFFADAVAAEPRQAVILACGLDLRPHRLSWPAGTTVFELDQPEVIEGKTRAMAALGARPAAPLRSIGIDLRDDWPAALRAEGFDPKRPTAWIAEGLMGYLAADAQDRFLDTVTESSSPGSRFAVDWLPDMSVIHSDRARAVFTSERANSGGVEVRDPAELTYLGERRAVDDYLSTLGWRVTTQTAEQRFEANGVTYRRDEALAGLCDAHFTSAVKP